MLKGCAAVRDHAVQTLACFCGCIAHCLVLVAQLAVGGCVSSGLLHRVRVSQHAHCALGRACFDHLQGPSVYFSVITYATQFLVC